MTGSHRPRKRFGQHFLAATWVQKIMDAIAPQPSDSFLEIGPGTGALTRPLAAAGRPVLAVEIDRHLAAKLAAEMPPNVTIVSGDVLELDLVGILSGLLPQRVPGDLGPDASLRRVRVVGNLPYYITGPILFRLIEWHRHHSCFADATLMVQREVADRLTARAGTKAYGTFGILVGRHANIERLLELPPGAFKPPPKVRSTLLRVTFTPPVVRVADERTFERLTKALFSQRRKTLSNALKQFHQQGADALAKSGLDGRRRPETLSPAELARLSDLLTVADRPAVL